MESSNDKRLVSTNKRPQNETTNENNRQQAATKLFEKREESTHAHTHKKKEKTKKQNANIRKTQKKETGYRAKPTQAQQDCRRDRWSRVLVRWIPQLHVRTKSEKANPHSMHVSTSPRPHFDMQ